MKRFFFEKASSLPLAALRIALAALLLMRTFFHQKSILLFLSRDGLIQGELSKQFETSDLLSLRAFSSFFEHFGVPEQTTLIAFLIFFTFCLILMGIGLYTRTFVVLAWLCNSMITAADPSSYGVDLYLSIFLFYLMFMPCGDSLSFDAMRKKSIDQTSWRAGFSLRILQIHLCIAYLGSALEKAKQTAWWNGDAIYQALNLPLYSQFDFSFFAYRPALCTTIGWVAMALEGGYILFIWPRRSRKLWLAAIVAMHLGIAFFLRLYLFGVTMVTLNLLLFYLPSRLSRSGTAIPSSVPT
jgi:hypothetical protein